MVVANLIKIRLNPPLQLLGKVIFWVYSVLVLYYRIFPKKVEVQALMKYYDIDGDGSITYEEFLTGLR